MALVNVKKKVEKSRSKLGLADDEQIIAGCTTNPSGTVKRMMAREMGGAVATVLSARSSEPGAPLFGDSMASRFPDGKRFLVLTNHRLFTTEISLLAGSPTTIDAEWNRDEVVTLTVEKSMMASPLQVAFSDGSAIQVEGATGSDPTSVAEAFTT